MFELTDENEMPPLILAIPVFLVLKISKKLTLQRNFLT